MDASGAATWTHADYIALFSSIATMVVGIAVVIATFRGPVIATRQADERREASQKRQRQLDVFRLLMGHRYEVKTPNFVLGLNSIQIEFADCPPVLNAFQAFMFNFR